MNKLFAKRLYARVLVLLVFVLLANLAGCGGGNGIQEQPTLPVVVRSNVKVLPLNGSLTISDITEDSVVLSGDVPTLNVGDVIVSGEGRGLLRKVRSISQEGERRFVLHTESATLTDVFQSADIRLNRELGYYDFASFEPAIDGVSFAAGSANSRSRQSVEIILTLTRVTIAERGSAKLEADGNVRMKVGIDLQIQLDSEGPKYVRFVPKLEMSASVGLKLTGEISLSKQTVQLGRMTGNPIVVFVGFVPVVFVPVVDLQIEAEANAEGGLEFRPEASLVLEGGLEFVRNTGWRPVAKAEPSFNILPLPNLYFQVELSKSQVVVPGLLIYGVVGPALKLYCPKWYTKLGVQTNPGGTKITVGSKLYGEAGFKVDVLGVLREDVRTQLPLEVDRTLLDLFIPADSSMEVEIK